IGVAVAICLAFKIVGFLGVGILGLLMMFVAFQADLTKGGTSSTYSIIPRPSHDMDHAGKAARRAEAQSLSHPILMGKLLGLCIAEVGFAASFFLCRRSGWRFFFVRFPAV